MSQQQKLERVLDLLLSEDSENAAELLHQIIVEKARVIYENIVDEEEVEEGDMEESEELEEADEVGGEPNKDFTKEIEADKDEIDSDEENDGEPEDDDESEDDEDLESRVDDLEAQLEELRAEFEEIMSDEMDEPEHMDSEEGEFGGMSGGFEEPEEESAMFEKKKHSKMEVADQPMKKPKKGKEAVEEETQFLSKVADTGQKGTAKLVGAGTHSKLGAEQTKSAFTNPPAKRSYGGEPVDFGKGTGGEYGKYHGDSAKDDTPSDNVDEEPKKVSHKADTTAKYTGGKAAGDGGSKSPFTKKPGGHV